MRWGCPLTTHCGHSLGALASSHETADQLLTVRESRGDAGVRVGRFRWMLCLIALLPAAAAPSSPRSVHIVRLFELDGWEFWCSGNAYEVGDCRASRDLSGAYVALGAERDELLADVEPACGGRGDTEPERLTASLAKPSRTEVADFVQDLSKKIENVRAACGGAVTLEERNSMALVFHWLLDQQIGWHERFCAEAPPSWAGCNEHQGR